MSGFKVSHDATFHRKVMKAGNEAVGAWVRAGSWSSHPANLTDGFIPSDVAMTIAPLRVWTRLLAAGLVEQREGGWQIHDYLKCNLSAARVRVQRQAWTARQRRARVRRQKSDARADSQNESPLASRRDASSDAQLRHTSLEPDPAASDAGAAVAPTIDPTMGPRTLPVQLALVDAGASMPQAIPRPPAKARAKGKPKVADLDFDELTDDETWVVKEIVECEALARITPKPHTLARELVDLARGHGLDAAKVVHDAGVFIGRSRRKYRDGAAFLRAQVEMRAEGSAKGEVRFRLPAEEEAPHADGRRKRDAARWPVLDPGRPPPPIAAGGKR